MSKNEESSAWKRNLLTLLAVFISKQSKMLKLTKLRRDPCALNYVNHIFVQLSTHISQARKNLLSDDY